MSELGFCRKCERETEFLNEIGICIFCEADDKGLHKGVRLDPNSEEFRRF